MAVASLALPGGKSCCWRKRWRRRYRLEAEGALMTCCSSERGWLPHSYQHAPHWRVRHEYCSCHRQPCWTAGGIDQYWCRPEGMMNVSVACRDGSVAKLPCWTAVQVPGVSRWQFTLATGQGRGEKIIGILACFVGVGWLTCLSSRKRRR